MKNTKTLLLTLALGLFLSFGATLNTVSASDVAVELVGGGKKKKKKKCTATKTECASKAAANPQCAKASSAKCAKQCSKAAGSKACTGAKATEVK